MNPTEQVTFKIIARMKSNFDTKFGIPRQSGLVPELKSEIVFEEAFRDPNAVRGLESFSYIWLVWLFSESVRDTWSPTVRPPRLGGNERVGVFSTRSPFRPNAIGLSCVRLEAVEYSDARGPVLHVSGADLMNGTPILDIKPYIPYADSHPDASPGFTSQNENYRLNVRIPEEISNCMAKEQLEALKGILSEDPRPQYQRNPERIYGMRFGDIDYHFRVIGDEVFVLTERELTDNAQPK